MQIDQRPAMPALPGKSDPSVSRVVLRDAVTNCVWFVVGTVGIALIGRVSRPVALTLAGIETLFAAIQIFKVLFILFADIFLFLSGRHEPDEADMRTASVIRVVELIIWLGCLFTLYKVFFP